MILQKLFKLNITMNNNLIAHIPKLVAHTPLSLGEGPGVRTKSQMKLIANHCLTITATIEFIIHTTQSIFETIPSTN